MTLLHLHHIGINGDGLDPKILELLSHGNAIVADPKVVPLRQFNLAIPDVSGERPHGE
jgi:hypothetical protein